MRDRLDRLARLLGRWNQRFAPRRLRQLDRWLLVHHPLVWRTRAHWMVWWSLIGSVACAAVALFWPQPSERAWTVNQLDIVSSGLGLVCLGLGICWANLQLRIGVGELRPRQHVWLITLNALALTALAMPLHAFFLGATYAISDALPDDTLERDLAFHAEHGFWRCRRGLDQSVIAAHEDRLHASLRRVGLQTRGELREWSAECEPGTASLVMWQLGRPEPDAYADVSRATALLRQRLESIQWSKLLWKEGRGVYSEERVGSFVRGLVLALTAAALLSAVSHPGYAWQRRWLKMGATRWQIDWRPWLPGWLARVDRAWLLSRPMLWATRVHIFAFYSVLASASLALVLIAVRLFFGKGLLDELESVGTVYVFLVLGAIGAGWPSVWALFRREDVVATEPMAWRSLIHSYFVATLPVPVMAAALGTALDSFSDEPGGQAAMLWVMFSATLSVVSICLVRTYCNRAATAGVSAGALALLITPLVLVAATEPEEETIFAASAGILVLWLISVGFVGRSSARSARISSGRESMAALIVAAAPVAWSYLVLGVIVASVLWTGLEENAVWYVAIPTMLLAYPLFIYGLRRPLGVLVRARHEPRAQ